MASESTWTERSSMTSATKKKQYIFCLEAWKIKDVIVQLALDLPYSPCSLDQHESSSISSWNLMSSKPENQFWVTDIFMAHGQ